MERFCFKGISIPKNFQTLLIFSKDGYIWKYNVDGSKEQVLNDAINPLGFGEVFKMEFPPDYFTTSKGGFDI